MGLLQDAYSRVFTAEGLNKTLADPRFQIGVGLLGRNDLPIGQAIGGTMNDYMRYQAMNQQYQAQQAAMAAAQEKMKREEEERQRQMQARAKVSQQFPQIGPVLDAYPNAAPQILASQYRSPTEAPSNVREWEYFNKLNDAQKQQYLTMKRANQIIDRGPEYVIPNPANPQIPMANIPKDLNPGERPEVRGAQAAAAEEGKIRAERETTSALDWPQVKQQGEYAIALVEDLLAHPGFSGAVGMKGAGHAFGLRETPIPGTKEAGFVSRLDQIKGQQFLEAFESLKGGGHITEIEGQKATDAVARMSTAQSEKDFQQAANEYKNIILLGLKRRAKSQGIDYTYQRPNLGGSTGEIRFLGFE